jgi:ATP phosphoribosyltransferase regulatory subunit
MKQVPMGLRDYLPHEIKKRDQLVQKMASVVMNHGYERIITPAIEHFDQLQQGLGDLSQDAIMFFDRAGSQLVLRPDHTTAIARIVSSRLTDQLPIKLYYHDPVFRRDPLLGETEIFQFGVEYVGDVSLDDEIQMIALVQAICDAVGLDDVELHVAHPELFSSMAQEDIDAIKEGNLLAFNQLPEKGTLALASQYPYLSTFFKQVNEKSLKDVYLNLGLYKDLDYYNGIYFDVVSKSFGKVIASGGRYDRVLNAFGLEKNAVGFAFRLHYLERALNHE